MTSHQCNELVKSELEKLELQYNSVELGVIDLVEYPSELKIEDLKKALQKWELEVMADKKAILVERIKNAIIEVIHLSKEFPKTNYSYYLSDKLQRDYTYLSNIFSDIEKMTIEHYIIFHKIERAKELLLGNELNVTEIARMLNYRNTAHFSNQFKKVSGYTPTFFKAMMRKSRT